MERGKVNIGRVLLLVSINIGLLLSFLPGVAWAEEEGWIFKGTVDPITDKSDAFAGITPSDGSVIGFFCQKGRPMSEFVVIAKTLNYDSVPVGSGTVIWRADSQNAREEKWSASPTRRGDGVINYGRPAFEFAQAVQAARSRVVLRNVNGTATFSVKGSNKAISQLLKFCALKQ